MKRTTVVLLMFVAFTCLFGKMSQNKTNDIVKLKNNFPGEIDISFENRGQNVKKIIGGGIFLTNKSINRTNIDHEARKFINEYSSIFNLKNTKLKTHKTTSYSNDYIITYQQFYRDVPVYNAYITINIAKDGRIKSLTNTFKDIHDISIIPNVSKNDAVKIANLIVYNKEDEEKLVEAELLIYYDNGTNTYSLCWSLIVDGEYKLLVDANNGELVIKENLKKAYPNIFGTIYIDHAPINVENPTVSNISECEDLLIKIDGAGTDTTDNGGGYSVAVDTNKTYMFESYLYGRHASVVNKGIFETSDTMRTLKHVYYSDARFDTSWSDFNHEDEYNLYYHMNEMWKYFKEEFTTPNPFMDNYWYNHSMPGEAKCQDCVTDTALGLSWGTKIGILEGHYNSSTIYHEYAHSVIYKINNRWIGDKGTWGGAIDEGLADYFSCSARNHSTMFGSGRSLDNDVKFPGEYFQEHYCGDILAAACWGLHDKYNLQKYYVDELIYKSINEIPPDTDVDFTYFFNLMVEANADGNIYNGTQYDEDMCNSFINDHNIWGKYICGNITYNDTIDIDETTNVINDLTLESDFVISSNDILKIWTDNTVDINGYNIKCLGNAFIDNMGSLNGYIVKNDSNSRIVGTYTSWTVALINAVSGQTVFVPDTISLASNLTIPSGVTLNITGGGEVNLGLYTITGNVEVESQGKLNPYICVETTGTDKYFPSLSSAISVIEDPSDILELNGEYTLTQDISIEDFILKIGSKSDITMNGKKIFVDWANNGTLSSLSSSAKFTPDLRPMSGTTNLGFYSDLSNAFSAGSLVEMRDTLISSADLTVPSGKTLKALSNSVMKMAFGKNLDVYGTLNANTTSFLSNSTTWGGIEFKSGSGGTVNGCYFKDAALAMNINYASPTIHDVLIDDCGYGIRIYGNTSDPNVYDNVIWDCNYGLYVRSTDANIHDNGIYDCSVYGLYLYSTSPDIYDNEIENSRVYLNSCYSTLTNNYIHGSTSSGYAMYIYNSDPYFFNNTITTEDDFTIETSNSYVCFGLDGQQGPPDCYGLNVLDNDEGNDGVIYATNGSEVILGYGDTGLYDCGYNSIYNRNYPLWTDGSSTIWAWDCYWGDDDAPDCVGDVEIGDELDEDPDDVGSTLGKSIQSSERINEYTSTEDSLYRYAYELVVESSYDLALAVLEEIITEYQESNYAYRALNLSLRLCNKSQVANSDEWLTKLSGIVDNDGLADIIDLKRVSNYHKGKKINEAITLSESISRKSNNKHEASTLFNLFNFYQKDKGDIKEAEKYFEKLKEKYPDHELTLIACSDMNEDYYNESLAKALVTDDYMAEELVLPETFKVHSAYPNPFNPSTTIEFELPVSASVECCIFDLRGNLIKDYKYNKQAGTHLIIWNGSNVPSGIYLIRFVAEAADGSESFVDYQKVTLLK